MFHPRLIAQRTTICSVAFAVTFLVASLVFAQPTECWVDAESGSDGNPGTEISPFETITYAVATSGDGDLIHVMPGTYDDSNGETFPIELRPNQILVGDQANRGEGAVPTEIMGKGPRQSPSFIGTVATLVCSEGSGVSGLRISPGVYEAGHVCVVVVGVTAEIEDNTFVDPSYAGVFLDDAGTSVVQDNTFESEWYGVAVRDCPDNPLLQRNEFRSVNIPIDVSVSVTNLWIRDNLFVGGTQVGIQVQHGAPLIENNTFDSPPGYTYGAIRAHSTGATPIIRENTFLCTTAIRVDDGKPDLGRWFDHGRNDFRQVTGACVLHNGSAAVPAIGNFWPHDPPIEGVDIVLNSDGTVILGPVPTVTHSLGHLKATYSDR